MTNFEFSKFIPVIQERFNTYKDLNREQMFSIFVEDKLKTTIDKYNLSLKANSSYLGRRSSYKILKCLTKIKRNQDREILKKYCTKKEMDD